MLLVCPGHPVEEGLDLERFQSRPQRQEPRRDTGPMRRLPPVRRRLRRERPDISSPMRPKFDPLVQLLTARSVTARNNAKAALALETCQRISAGVASE